MSTATLPDLRGMTEAELVTLGTADDDITGRGAVWAELDRRETAAQLRAARRMADSAWAEAAHAQYLQADQECRGNLLSRRGQAAGVDPWSLWSGPRHVAEAYASEELRGFWETSPRLTVTDWRLAMSADREAERVAAEVAAAAEEIAAADAEAEEAEALGVPTFADASHEPLEMVWLVQDRVPRGHVVVAAGMRESGKGLVGWGLASAVVNGSLLPGETGDPGRIAAGLSPKEPGDVIGVWDEDDANEDNAWRARAAGVEDLSRVIDFSTLPGGTPFELSAARGDMGHLPDLLALIRRLRVTCLAGHRREAREPVCGKCGGPMRNPLLVILDPLDNLVMNGTVQSTGGAIRLMRRLEFVARRTGVTIWLVHHLRENGKVGGSSKVVDVPRWVFRIEKDEAAPELWALCKHKSNQGSPAAMRYRLVKDGHNSRVEWVAAEQIVSEERSWREGGPRHLRAVAVPAALAWAAACETAMPGQPPRVRSLPGIWASREAAQEACQASAPAPLAWQASRHTAATWTAVIPGTPDDPEIFYAVSGR